MKYGVMDGGSVKKFFETSENSLYRKMFSHMREYKTFVPNTTTGVKRAREENYAYITEYPYLEYHNLQKPCNTKLLNNLIQTKSYGLGLQRNSPYTNRITVAILKVREIVFAMHKLVFYLINRPRDSITLKTAISSLDGSKAVGRYPQYQVFDEWFLFVLGLGTLINFL